MTILFICTGNIHRSAHAEAILREEARRDGRSDVRSLSAGVLAVDGMEAVGEAADEARREGLDLAGHRSRPVSPELLTGADMILVMENFHREWLAASHPDALERCRMLSEYAGDVARAFGVSAGDDVPDADGGDVTSFQRSFSIIRDCVRRLYRQLPPAPQEIYVQAIEERFRARRHTPLTLSPADFGRVETWWNRGIPLWIVLDSLDDLFRRKEAAGDPSRVRSLAYIRQEVEERFEALQRSSSEPPDGTRRDVVPGDGLLQQAARRLQEAAEGARRRGLTDAGDLLDQTAMKAAADASSSADSSAARLRLHDLEEELLAMLRRLAGADEMRTLRDRASEQLTAHRERMTPAAFEATVSRLIAQHIKDRYGVPDLTQI